jgi:hypothetical protein
MLPLGEGQSWVVRQLQRLCRSESHHWELCSCSSLHTTNLCLEKPALTHQFTQTTSTPALPSGTWSLSPPGSAVCSAHSVHRVKPAVLCPAPSLLISCEELRVAILGSLIFDFPETGQQEKMSRESPGQTAFCRVWNHKVQSSSHRSHYKAWKFCILHCTYNQAFALTVRMLCGAIGRVLTGKGQSSSGCCAQKWGDHRQMMARTGTKSSCTLVRAPG